MALMTSLVALSIDSMLPALPEIGTQLNVSNPNHNQLVISLLFLGLSIGQMIFGPLSDSIGRKPAIYFGFIIVIFGYLLSVTATNFYMMLAGRFLQGFGLSGPRIITMALIRDQYHGDAMAKVMSFIMMVFILVPCIAPIMGQGILLVGTWRYIFAFNLILIILAAIWFWHRQPETLKIENRIPFSVKRIISAIVSIVSNRVSMAYTLISGLVFSAFLGYITSAQQVFQIQYDLGKIFPFVFATLALSIGLAGFLNGRIVMQYGSQLIVRKSIRTKFFISCLFLGITWFFDGNPPLFSVIMYFILVLFCVGFLFGNVNSLAMEPLGHIAGLGSAVIGSVSTLIGVSIGGLIGQSYDGTIIPMIIGFVILSGLSSLLMIWVENSNKY